VPLEKNKRSAGRVSKTGIVPKNMCRCGPKEHLKKQFNIAGKVVRPSRLQG